MYQVIIIYMSIYFKHILGYSLVRLESNKMWSKFKNNKVNRLTGPGCLNLSEPANLVRRKFPFHRKEGRKLAIFYRHVNINNYICLYH